MELTLEQTELAVLVLHMNVMRHNIKKGFKSNYGRSEGKEKTTLYDGLKELFQDELNEEIGDSVCLDLDRPQMEMLHSFINWYVLEIKVTIDNKDIEKAEQVMILEGIKQKVNTLATALEEIL